MPAWYSMRTLCQFKSHMFKPRYEYHERLLGNELQPPPAPFFQQYPALALLVVPQWKGSPVP